MRVLITNHNMRLPTGTGVFTRDLALELKRQGHEPAVFAWLDGPLSDALRAAGIPVFGDPRARGFAPEILHGHHAPVLLEALARHPGVPAIFVCHDHENPRDRWPAHPRVRRAFGVSALCLERLRREGAPPERTAWLPNFVDLRRFSPRPPLPARPARALLFSNYANASTHLPAVAEACRRLGLPLDVLGEGAGTSSLRPEDVLGRYDLVFAKAKAAMEAMAVGAAVVLCDFGGVGPMVTAAEFDSLRPLNFGFQALRDPLTPEAVLSRIGRYDPADAARVRDRIRAEAGLESAAARLASVYREVLGEPARAEAGGEGGAFGRAAARLRFGLARRAGRAYYAVFRVNPFRLGPAGRIVHAAARGLARAFLRR